MKDTNKRYELKNNNVISLLIPWIFFPLTLNSNLLFSVIVFVLISICFYIFTSKSIIFYDHEVIVEKYKWVFKKQKTIYYNNISSVYFNILSMSVSYDSTFLIYTENNKSPEKISFLKVEFEPFKSFLHSKNIKIRSNNKDYNK
jgi:hypothetical protein